MAVNDNYLVNEGLDGIYDLRNATGFILRWNDDAAYLVVSDPGLGWRELRYPLGHEYELETLDLAFVITPEPATLGVLLLGGLALLVSGRKDRR